jgi:hypothetical protein
MSVQNRQWISLDEPINEYMSEAELSNHKYFKLWHLAFRALTELGLDAFYVVRAVKLPVNANLTVTLPADYLNYSKVGVLNQQGEIIPMGINNKLTTAFDLMPTRLEQTQDNSIQTEINETGIWWYNYWNGGGYGNVYGLPSGSPFIGNFKIDNANGVIVLSENFSYPYVMLEYVASPKEGGEYYVPIQFKEAVIAYLRWKDIISMPVKTHVANSNVQMRRHDYYNERRLAIARYDPINLPDLYQWNLEQQRITVKA